MTPEQRFDIITYRINSAENLLYEIKDHIVHGYYNTAMNRMYYACFYAASALLLHLEIDGIKSHEGVRQMFRKHVILNNLLPKEWENSILSFTITALLQIMRISRITTWHPLKRCIRKYTNLSI